MVIDIHMHPLVRDAEYIPDLSTVMKSFFRPQAAARIEKGIKERALDDIISDMDESGIDTGVIVAMDMRSALGVVMVSNESVAGMVQRFPDRFIGFASVDPNLGRAAIKELERAVRDLGLQGLKLAPPVQQFAPNSRKLRPLWEKACDLNVPVWFHSGHQISTSGSKAQLGHPALIDELAASLPELTIIMGHCACPWFWDAWSVFCRHENVYLDISSYPKLYNHFPWDAYSKYNIEHKLLFATDYPLHDFESCINAVESLGISDGFKKKIFAENAARILPIKE